jgi:hypothetical protein
MPQMMLIVWSSNCLLVYSSMVASKTEACSSNADRQGEVMPNKNRDKKNQPPTGEGKKQSPRSGESHKLDKRSEVLQAQRGHAEENIAGDEGEEFATHGEGLGEASNPQRAKAGR